MLGLGDGQTAAALIACIGITVIGVITARSTGIPEIPTGKCGAGSAGAPPPGDAGKRRNTIGNCKER